jgi:Icc protein
VSSVDDDGIDRRGFLGCMAWAGSAVVLSACGGSVSSKRVGKAIGGAAKPADFTFVQISDSHIGFNHAPNTDVVGTYTQAVAKINALPHRPAFVLHTGDHVHLSTPEEFDTVKQITSTIKTDRTYHVPGEHDVFVDQGKLYKKFFGKAYYSFDYKGTHFLGLSNVQASESETGGGMNGLGRLGHEQLAWIKKDLKPLSSDTPVVVFGHVPLLAVYPKWGWATADSTQVLSELKRFSSVTVLNGHIHQLLAKHEGRITMHTANSTAFPQHTPGVDAPGPYDLPAGRLPSMIGIRTVSFAGHRGPLALKDETLG